MRDFEEAVTVLSTRYWVNAINCTVQYSTVPQHAYVLTFCCRIRPHVSPDPRPPRYATIPLDYIHILLLLNAGGGVIVIAHNQRPNTSLSLPYLHNVGYKVQ